MINIGDKFICYKETHFDDNPNGRFIFKQFKIYESEKNGCITPETRNKYHTFTDPYWTERLIRLDDNAMRVLNYINIPLGDRIVLRNMIKRYMRHGEKIPNTNSR